MGDQDAGTYVERAPHPALCGDVVCAWHDHGGPDHHRVVPDACIDIVWDGDTLHVAGPNTYAFEVTSTRALVGVRFRPGLASSHLGLPASELRDRAVPLVDLWGKPADELAERLAAAPSPSARQIERMLVGRAERRADQHDADTFPTALLAELTRGWRQHGPADPTVGQAAQRLGVGERALHRRSSAAFGYGPKTLQRIVRFRRVVRLRHSGLTLSELALLAGYADEAHLSRECRRLCGLTASEVVHSGRVILSADGQRPADPSIADARTA